MSSCACSCLARASSSSSAPSARQQAIRSKGAAGGCHRSARCSAMSSAAALILTTAARQGAFCQCKAPQYRNCAGSWPSCSSTTRTLKRGSSTRQGRLRLAPGPELLPCHVRLTWLIQSMSQLPRAAGAAPAGGAAARGAAACALRLASYSSSVMCDSSASSSSRLCRLKPRPRPRPLAGACASDCASLSSSFCPPPGACKHGCVQRSTQCCRTP